LYGNLEIETLLAKPIAPIQYPVMLTPAVLLFVCVLIGCHAMMSTNALSSSDVEFDAKMKEAVSMSPTEWVEQYCNSGMQKEEECVKQRLMERRSAKILHYMQVACDKWTLCVSVFAAKDNIKHFVLTNVRISYCVNIFIRDVQELPVMERELDRLTVHKYNVSLSDAVIGHTGQFFSKINLIQELVDGENIANICEVLCRSC
jgi:hypothetical protein